MTKNEAFKRWRVQEPFVNLHCLLGEGPYYEKTTHSLRFVDIRKQQLHTVPLHTPELAHTIQLDEPVSVTADVEGINPTHKILVALKYGLAILDRSVGRYEYTHRFPRNESMRSNDGAVDPSGQFWVGTMSDFGIWPLQPLGTT
jgi:sugar lactone lactonase YvrE